ncbi:GNAT family N-acetyltransferase [Bdellovibrio sp. HCB290]|uniref:GNAT family N-acetyltransferase n=1 Tax=Bdellovibrio sp. HCB290 TaxID=3394356 RepID=UPI0039B5526E
MPQIRRALIEDAPGIHDAHMRSIQEICSKDHSPEEIKGWGNRPYSQENRLHAIKNHSVWVVEDSGKIEGYAQIAFNEKEGMLCAHVLGLYLTTSVVGTGVGKKLLQLMIEEIKAKRVCKVTLESTMTAHGFYKKFGFVDSAPEILAQIGGSGVRCQPMKMEMAYL